MHRLNTQGSVLIYCFILFILSNRCNEGWCQWLIVDHYWRLLSLTAKCWLTTHSTWNTATHRAQGGGARAPPVDEPPVRCY